MVDYYGRWTYKPDTPKEKKCDLDRLADEILRQIKESNDQTGSNEEIETTVENVVDNIYLLLADDIEEMETFDVGEIMELVAMSGGLTEFDFWLMDGEE